MHELRVEPPSEATSEEKTEPFSQSEIDARLKSFRDEQRSHAAEAAQNSAVPLDDLVVPADKADIRLLFRPHRSRSVSPGNHDNCEWLALRAEVAAPGQPEHKVLAVTQTSRDIKFWFRIPSEVVGERMLPPLWNELYYDPQSDNQIFWNKSDIPVTLMRQTGSASSPDLSPEYEILPERTKALSPGTWRIRVRDVDVLDFRILEKQPALLVMPSGSSPPSSHGDMLNSSGKRSFTADDDAPQGLDKRIRSLDVVRTNGGGAVEFTRPGGGTTNTLIFPLPTAAKGKEIVGANSHPLLDLEKGDVAGIPGGCEMDTYQLKKREPIASTTLSSVFTGEHSDVPENVITVKVLKTRPPTSSNALARPYDQERNVIRQADIWMREYESHENLRHDQIVRLYGGDARYLSLYMEHVDARDLASKGTWRSLTGEYFTGTRDDARRILRDIAGALSYIHSRNLVHNDIKPANVLYSRERGAVLCDFGLSTPAQNPPTTGGTPYYVPPEFIGHRMRGAPSDVWALGVTMLYVLRKLVFPESRARHTHPRPLHWQINELNPRRGQRLTSGAGGAGGLTAVLQMRMWLAEVNEAKERLDPANKLERLVAEMLLPNPAQRITMTRLRADLFSENGVDE